LAQQASGYTISSKNFNIIKKLMCTNVQNLEFLLGLDVETDLSGVQTGVTTCLIGPSVPNSSILSSQVDNSVTDDPKSNNTDATDWRRPIVDYLQDPNQTVDQKVRRLVFKFTLVDEELYCRTADDLLLKCLDSDQAKVAMGEVHEGIYDTHQTAPKMKWLLRRDRFYWLTMIVDCFRYYKGCEECQKFGNVQLVPAAMMHPIIKPWPFRGWGLDFIVQIHPPSSKGHRFMLVATDYFIKWTKVVPLKNMTHNEIIEFIMEHIIHRFSIPQPLTVDQVTSFVSG
jgi:hypothetical protein